MPKFKVNYSYLQGPDHHSQDYMTPDAPLQRCNDSRVVETASKEEVEKKFRELVLFGCAIDSIEEIKE